MPSISLTTGELAALLSAELTGDAGVTLSGVDTISRAGPGDLTFARDSSHARSLADSKAGAAIVSRTAAGDAPSSLPLLVVDDADQAMIALLEQASAMIPADTPEPGVHPSAVVDPTARLGEGVTIGPCCVVGPGASIGDGSSLVANVTVGRDASIGKGCTLRPGVVIEARCSLGDGCVLHPGVVIGADGFGYRPAPDGNGLIKIPHIGAVRVGHGVEIGANTTVDRGKLGDTTIGDGTKIDNLVQIGHNADIGRACVLCGQAGLGGSVTLGDGVVFGGKAGARDNITIGAGARLGGASGAARSIPAGEAWAGTPAMPARQHLRFVSIMNRAELMIEELYSRLETLEAERLS